MLVRIFRNLGSAYKDQRAWTINAAEGPRKGKVIDIVDALIITDVVFIVSEATRKRVVAAWKAGKPAKEKHAFAEGVLGKTWPVNTLPKDLDGNDIAPGKGATVLINYNPYTMKTFTRLDCGEPVGEVPLVVFAPQGVFGKLGKCGTKRAQSLRGVGSIRYSVDDWNG